MKTYTVDGGWGAGPGLSCQDDDAAAAWLTGWVGKWYADTFAARNKALTVRPATIPEQAAWRAQSVRMQCEFEGVEEYFADEEQMPDVLPNPDTYLCTLGEDSDSAVITVEMTSRRGEQTVSSFQFVPLGIRSDGDQAAANSRSEAPDHCQR